MVINEKLLPFTDYVVEEGNNYIKYNNGIMIQWGSALVNVAMQTQHGSGGFYRPANTVSATFPQSFIDTSYSLTLTARASINYTYMNGKRTNGFDFWPMNMGSVTAANRYVDYVAVGKWK